MSPLFKLMLIYLMVILIPVCSGCKPSDETSGEEIPPQILVELSGPPAPEGTQGAEQAGPVAGPIIVTLATISTSFQADQPASFTAIISGLTSAPRFEWIIDQQKIADITQTITRFFSEGSHTLQINIFDGQNQLLGSATKNITVSAAATQPPPPPGAGTVAARTKRVSVATDGTQANGRSFDPSASADGRFVAFSSEAANLIVNDTNGFLDIFLRDTQTGETKLTSVSTDGAPGNGHSSHPSISADGTRVVFQSSAANLVPNDTNNQSDIFLNDTATGETKRISMALNGVQANGFSLQPAISADGKFVVFHSLATNLVTGDTNALSDLFLHNTVTGETKRISVASSGAQANQSALSPTLSADARFVAFHSDATNLVTGDTNAKTDIFLRNMQTAETKRISVAPNGTQANNISFNPSISANGEFVAFYSSASNLDVGDTNITTDIFLHNTATRETKRIVLSDLTASSSPAIPVGNQLSADSRFIVFQTLFLQDIATGKITSRGDVFVLDTATGGTKRVSVAPDGTEGNGASLSPAISADGRFVVFESTATNLVTGDTNNAQDIFIHGP